MSSANPLRAGLVKEAQDWRWSSLRSRLPKSPAVAFALLSPLPIDLPRNWAGRIREVLQEAHSVKPLAVRHRLA